MTTSFSCIENCWRGFAGESFSYIDRLCKEGKSQYSLTQLCGTDELCGTDYQTIAFTVLPVVFSLTCRRNKQNGGLTRE